MPPAPPGLDARSRPESYTASSSRRVRASTRSSDFLDFLHSLLDLCFAPITFPLKVVRNVITSPLTISLVLQLILLGFLILSSAIFSILAVGAFWWSWSTGGVIEAEGWLVYGSRGHRTPHTLITLPVDRFQEDLAYDVQVELELVRPSRGVDETGNFMVSLELWSLRSPDLILSKAAQPSLPPSPLTSSVLPISSLSSLLPPCLLPWPFRSLCPSRLLGLSLSPPRTGAAGRKRDGFRGAIKKSQVVLLSKDLLDGVVMRPGLGGDAVVGSAFVSIGREDSFSETETGPNHRNEIRTTGLVVVRFLPRPTGLRWLLTSNPLPPLILLPPLSLALTLTSSIMAFGIITCLRRPRRKTRPTRPSSKRVSSRPAATDSPVAVHHHPANGGGVEKGKERVNDSPAATLRDRDRGRPSLGTGNDREHGSYAVSVGSGFGQPHASPSQQLRSRAAGGGVVGESGSSNAGSSNGGRDASVASNSDETYSVSGTEETATEDGDGDGDATSQVTESEGGWEDTEWR